MAWSIGSGKYEEHLLNIPSSTSLPSHTIRLRSRVIKVSTGFSVNIRGSIKSCLDWLTEKLPNKNQKKGMMR